MAQSFIYFCPCLNVTVRFQGGRTNSASVDDADDNRNVDWFFSDAVCLNAPQGATVTIKLKCLCQNREANSWTITTCINCGIDTHAVMNSDDSRLWVSEKMRNDPSDEKRLIQLESFSSLYQIVVQPFTNSEGSFGTTGFPLLLEEPLVGHQADEIRHKTATFLDNEKEITKERIRNYKKEQLLQLKEVESRMLQDQNILMQRLKMALEKQKRGSLPTIQQEIITAKQVSGKNVGSSLVCSPTFDVFAMDEDDVFSPSEAESSDSLADECPSDDAPQPKDINSRLYATSLPISMPDVWKSSRVKQQITEDESPPSEKDTIKTDDPQWMAASIQAIAMSVRGTDGTEMFGARPRPRLNTLD